MASETPHPHGGRGWGYPPLTCRRFPAGSRGIYDGEPVFRELSDRGYRGDPPYLGGPPPPPPNFFELPPLPPSKNSRDEGVALIPPTMSVRGYFCFPSLPLPQFPSISQSSISIIHGDCRRIITYRKFQTAGKTHLPLKRTIRQQTGSDADDRSSRRVG